MEHSERLALAHALTQRMAETYPLLVGGVYGSTARAEDTTWSDLEMWFVVEDGCQARSKQILLRDTAVGWRVFQESELLDLLTSPDLRWPFHMGVLDVLEVLHGDPALPGKYLERGLQTPPEQFRRVLADRLPELVVESHGRAHSAAQRGDFGTARYAVIEVLFEMQTALCLLNRRWVTRDYDAGLMQVSRFAKVPAGYAELVPTLIAATGFDCLPALDRLVREFWALVSAENIDVSNYQAVEHVPI